MATSGVPGNATITATSDGISGTTEIAVLPTPVAVVEVSPASGAILVGRTLQLTAVTRAASGAVLSGRETTWNSSDATIASVDQSGLVTGMLAGGPVEITAVSEGRAGISLVTVLESVTVASVVGDKDGFGLDLMPGDEKAAGGALFDAREPDDPDFTDSWPAPSDFTYTHTFEVPDGGMVSSATIRWLTLGIQDGDSQVAGSDIDMVLELDGVEVQGAFDTVDQFRHNGTIWVEVVGLVEIPLEGPILEVLQDGEVEVRIRILQLASGNLDGVSFDYSELEVVVR
jgi:hypothetical protein